MSTTTFDGSLHPRATDGKFTAKTTDETAGGTSALNLANPSDDTLCEVSDEQYEAFVANGNCNAGAYAEAHKAARIARNSGEDATKSFDFTTPYLARDLGRRLEVFHGDGNLREDAAGRGVHVSLAAYRERGAAETSVVTLKEIKVWPTMRGQGRAHAVLNDLTLAADRQGWTLTLQPDDLWGTPLEALYRLYGAHGFVPNPDRLPTKKARDAYRRECRKTFRDVDPRLVDEMVRYPRQTVFHVTTASALKQIQSEGLVPRVGERSEQLGEEPAVFLFPSEEALNDATWLAEQFNDDEEFDCACCRH